MSFFFADQSRRSFVKTFVVGTVSTSILGQPWRKTFVAAADPLPAGNNIGIIEIKLSDYPVLRQEFSSIRIGVNGIDEDGVTPSGFFYPIIVSRAAGNQFHALDAGCAHAGCVVLPYDGIDQAIFCPCHGSSYAIDGSVLTGPTTSPLTAMDITFDRDNTLVIRVPNLGYSVSGTVVLGADSPRLRLDFPTYFGVEYEVRFRSGVDAPWTAVPFSMTLDGPLDQQSLLGDERPASLFVTRTGRAGFYAVAIKILDLTPQFE